MELKVSCLKARLKNASHSQSLQMMWKSKPRILKAKDRMKNASHAQSKGEKGAQSKGSKLGLWNSKPKIEWRSSSQRWKASSQGLKWRSRWTDKMPLAGRGSKMKAMPKPAIKWRQNSSQKQAKDRIAKLKGYKMEGILKGSACQGSKREWSQAQRQG